MEICKRERGFGKSIHDAIHKWFRSYDIHKLERMFIEHRSGYNWKAQDVMRLMKPKPIDKKESLLFRWLAKDGIDESDAQDYERHFPLIYNYELMRHDKILALNSSYLLKCIENYGFKNNMIPGHIKRAPEVFAKWYNFSSKNHFPAATLPNHINLLSVKSLEQVNSTLTSESNILSLLTLLILHTKVKEVANRPVELKTLDIIESELISKIKKTHSNVINIVDTNVNMFDKTLIRIGVTPAVASSVMIGVSKNVIDFDGNVIGKRDPRAIIEAEGYTKISNKVNYNNIFNSMKGIDSNVVFVWTNNRQFNKQLFFSKFKKWKRENNKIMKLVIVNLMESNGSTNYDFKEIYGLNKKTETLIKYIKDGII